MANWSMGFYQPWISNGYTVDKVLWAGLTHICHVCVSPNSNGTVDPQLLTPDAAHLVGDAHLNSVKAILDVFQLSAVYYPPGGDFAGACANYRSTLVNSIMNVVNSYGYDGVNINWEPFNTSTNGAAMTALLTDLRAALTGGRLLTASCSVGEYTYWGTNHANLDRLGVMTYDMSYPQETQNGTQYSWFHNAIYHNDPWTSSQHWSMDMAKNRFLGAGVPAAKLMLGLPFYGRMWGGVNAPRIAGADGTNDEIEYYQIRSALGL